MIVPDRGFQDICGNHQHLITIRPATFADATVLARLGKETFLESHGHSAGPDVIAAYVADKYTPAVLQAELEDPRAIYHIAFAGDEPVGFTKLLFNQPHPNVPVQTVAKLERIYVLEAHFDKKAGQALFEHAVQLARTAGQQGLWLFTWKENARAIRFYEKNGFRIAGTYDFHLSPEHANPNWQLFLAF